MYVAIVFFFFFDSGGRRLLKFLEVLVMAVVVDDGDLPSLTKGDVTKVLVGGIVSTQRRVFVFLGQKTSVTG